MGGNDEEAAKRAFLARQDAARGAAAGTAAEAAVEAAEGTAGVEVARRALTMPRPRESWRRRGRHQAQVEGRAAVALHRRPTRRHRVAACLPKRV